MMFLVFSVNKNGAGYNRIYGSTSNKEIAEKAARYFGGVYDKVPNLDKIADGKYPYDVFLREKDQALTISRPMKDWMQEENVVCHTMRGSEPGWLVSVFAADMLEAAQIGLSLISKKNENISNK